MATPRWTGNALATYDVWTMTAALTWEVGDLLTITMGGRTFSYAVTSTTIATFLPLLATAYNLLDADLYPEHVRFTATSTATTLVLTEDTAGVPHTITVTTTEANGDVSDSQTWTASNTTVATGPNFWSNVSNWDTGALPIDGDTVYIENSNIDILYGISLASIELTALNIAASYTGKIGLPRINADGYAEYRTRYLTIDATTVNIGYGAGAGSSRINLSLPDLATTVNVSKTGSPIEDGVPALLVLAAEATAALNVTKGSVGSAIFGTETATWKTIKIGHETNQATDANVWFGSGCTLNGASSTYVQNGGVVRVDATLLTVTKNEGTLHMTGAAAATTIYNRGGLLIDESTGTFTTLHNSASYVRRGLKAKTITNLFTYGDKFNWDDQNGVVVYTNAPQFYETSNIGGRFQFGRHRKITIADI